MEVELLLAVAIIVCSLSVYVSSERNRVELDKRISRLERRLSGIRDAVDGW